MTNAKSPQRTTMRREETPTLQDINTLAAMFSEGRYKEAALLAKSMTVRFPCHGFGWKVLGAVFKQMGQNGDALVHMQKAAELSPGDAEAHSNLASALKDFGRLEEAEVGYRRALEIRHDFAEAHNNLGVTLQELGRSAEAAASYRLAVEFKPDFYGAYYNLGNLLKALRRLAEANSSYRQALLIRSDIAEGHCNLGNNLNDLGQLTEAVASYRRALQIKPDFAEAQINLGVTLHDLGRADEAVASYRRALKIKPGYAEAYANLGNTLKDMGRLDEALANYRLSLNVGGDWREALRRLTTPLVLHPGMVLGSDFPGASFAGASKQDATLGGMVARPIEFSVSPGQPHLRNAEHSNPVTRKNVRIVLIYPPPWQIPSPGDLLQGMPFGPPKDRSDHDLSGDFQNITYGLLTLAAQARNAGHDVSVYNLSTSPWRDVEKLIAKTEADVYGISAFTANRRGMGAVAALIRQQHPEAHITVGGPFVTALPLETLKYYRDIDTAVIGEGEETFMELLECLTSGRPAVGIPGTAWRNGEKIVFGPTRPRIKDLDALASPFDYFTSYIVMTSRGCPSKCTFCGSFTTWGKMLRFHSAETCVDIFRKALAGLPVPFLAIMDDTFTANRRRAIAICDAIIENKMNFIWSCNTRVDSLDDELLRKMRLAGCQMISLGVESGSPEILKAMRKETTPEMVLESTRSAQKYGMQVRYYMILINRGETPETIQQSNNLIKVGRPNRYYSSALSFFPGTEDWAILCEKQGLTSDIFFRNDFKELTVATNRCKELNAVMQHVACDIGAVFGFDYTVEEREAVVASLPDLHSAHIELANAYLRAGRLSEAELALNRAEELGFPIGHIINNQRACIALARSEVVKALSLLERALQSNPNQIVMKNHNLLRAWVDAPVNNRRKPPVLNDSVLAKDFQVSHQPQLHG